MRIFLQVNDAWAKDFIHGTKNKAGNPKIKKIVKKALNNKQKELQEKYQKIALLLKKLDQI